MQITKNRLRLMNFHQNSYIKQPTSLKRKPNVTRIVGQAARGENTEKESQLVVTKLQNFVELLIEKEKVVLLHKVLHKDIMMIRDLLRLVGVSKMVRYLKKMRMQT